MYQGATSCKEPVQVSWTSGSMEGDQDVYDDGYTGNTYATLQFDRLGELTNGTVNLRARNMKSLRLDPTNPKLEKSKGLLLDFNAFQELPDCILQMRNLEVLSLMCQVDPGQASREHRPALMGLPENMDRLAKLRSLNCGYNAISSLPQAMAKLTLLQDLDLRLNQFEVFPDVICSITSLKRLVLSGNYLRGIPKEIKQLTQLEQLHLGNNRIENLPNEISHLRDLRTLVLRNNKIKILPKVMFKMKSLVVMEGEPSGACEGRDDDEDQGLKLEENPLTWPPQHVWSGNTSILFTYLERHYKGRSSELRLTHRKKGLAELDALIHQNPTVEFIDVRQNRLRVLPQNLRNVKQLDTLLLDENCIEEFQVQILSELTNLRVLSLNEQSHVKGATDDDYCETVSQLPDDIYLCKSLEELYFAKNCLNTIPSSLECLNHLRVLDVQYNNLQEVSPGVCALPNLECLCLSHNKLKSIPEEIGQLKRLRVLRLSKNDLSFIPVSICSLPNLMTLSLRKNKLKYLPPEITKLKKLAKEGKYVTQHMTYKNELKVEDNASIEIPPATVCQRDVDSIFEYFEDMERNNPDYLRSNIQRLERKVCSKPMTDIQLLEQSTLARLSQKIGHEYHTLFSLLGIEHAVIQHMTSAHPGNVQAQIYDLFQRWLRSHSSLSVEEQVSILAHALEEVGRRDLVDTYLMKKEQLYRR